MHCCTKEKLRASNTNRRVGEICRGQADTRQCIQKHEGRYSNNTAADTSKAGHRKPGGGEGAWGIHRHRRLFAFRGEDRPSYPLQAATECVCWASPMHQENDLHTHASCAPSSKYVSPEGRYNKQSGQRAYGTLHRYPEIYKICNNTRVFQVLSRMPEGHPPRRI